MPMLSLDDSGEKLNGRVENENFDAFLRICFSRSTHFSMSKRVYDDIQAAADPVEAALAEYAVKSLVPQCWYGYPYGCGQGELIETVYTANGETLNILLGFFSDIFLNSRKGYPEIQSGTFGMLEDLCFWSDNTMLVGTLSHEFMCATNEISGQFADELRQVGDWQTVDRDFCGITGAKWY